MTDEQKKVCIVVSPEPPGILIHGVFASREKAESYRESIGWTTSQYFGPSLDIEEHEIQ